MHPRLTISAIFLSSTLTHAIVFPTDLFLPRLNFKDSLSVLHVNSGSTTASVRYVPGASHGTIRSAEVHGVSNGQDGLDSASIHVEWDSRIPSFGADLFDCASSFKRTLFTTGSEPLTDSGWSVWDAASRRLVRYSNENKDCEWLDSSVFDESNRLIYQKSCVEDDLDEEGNAIAPSAFVVYQAWFESATDTLPRRAWSRDPRQLFDSVVSYGPANRPDSLGGSGHLVLVRNTRGKVVVLHSTQDTTRFEYDASDRVIREFNPESELRIAYSWNDPVGIRPSRSIKRERVNIVNGGLRIDLSAPEHLRIERISPDGKRLSLLADRNLPAGRSFLPIAYKAGDLVRVECANRTTILVAPPR